MNFIQSTNLIYNEYIAIVTIYYLHYNKSNVILRNIMNHIHECR